MTEFLVLLSIMLESSYKWQSNSSNVTKDYFWYRYEWEHQYTSSSLSNQKPEGKRPKTAPAADPKGEEVKVKTNSIKLKHEISICSFFVHGTNQSSLYLDQKMLFLFDNLKETQFRNFLFPNSRQHEYLLNIFRITNVLR